MSAEIQVRGLISPLAEGLDLTVGPDRVLHTAGDRPDADTLPALADPAADHRDQAVSRRRGDVEEKHARIIGFLDAWDGVRERRTMPLTIDFMRGSLPRGGTMLGTRRGSPYDTPDGVNQVRETLADLGIGALIVVGGNGSLTVAHRLAIEEGLPIVGVPKTIDNDIVGTDTTFGFHT
ncbi:MAG: 6-phosphofructokinase, partial [Singulisphaera sp.]